MTDGTPYVGTTPALATAIGSRRSIIRNGRQVDFNYGTTGTANNSLDRLSTITDNSTGQTLAAYSYLGLEHGRHRGFPAAQDQAGLQRRQRHLYRPRPLRPGPQSNMDDYGNDTTADGYSFT